MNYVISKFEDTLKDKKIYFFIVLIMFCIGISFGLYIVKYMNESDKSDLVNYFDGFTKYVVIQDTNYIKLLKSTVIKNVFIVIPIIVFGLTFIGFPFILSIDLLKGFLLGYTFSCVAYAYKGRGMLLAITSILPQNLFYIPCLIALSVIFIQISNEKFQYKFFKLKKKEKLDKQELFSRLFIIIILFCIGIFIETYVTPSIIKMVVK